MENVIVGAAKPLFNANPTAQIRIICEEELLTYTTGRLLSAGLTLALRYVTVAYYTPTPITASPLCYCYCPARRHRESGLGETIVLSVSYDFQRGVRFSTPELKRAPTQSVHPNDVIFDIIPFVLLNIIHNRG